MSSEPEAPAPSAARLHTAAYALAGSAVGTPIVIAALVQAVLYQLNPGGRDLSGFGAYQAEVGVTLLIGIVVMAIVVARVFTLLARVDRPALRYPLLIVQLQIGFAAATIVLLLLSPGLL